MPLSKKTVLYFAPHQDDELLSMGIDICASLKKKYNVHVILCSDGSKSYVKKLLNNGKPCKKHDGIHKFELSTDEFIQARDREFIDSCLALGVPKSNIHIPEKRAIDGSICVSYAEALIRSYISRFGGNTEVCTISPNNGPAQHRDHKNVGKAAENLLHAGVIRKVRFFIEPYLFDQIKDNPRLIPVAPTNQTATTLVERKIESAVGSYSLWAPEQQRYAVGYHSVTTEFQDFLQEKTCHSFEKFHPASMTPTEKLHEQHRKWLKLKYQTQLYYSCTKLEAPLLGDADLVHIHHGDTDGYISFCQHYQYPFREKDLQRIRDGSSFWCLISKEQSVISRGWLAYRHAFYIGETDFGFQMDSSDCAILYDFQTDPDHRGKGLYGQLLRAIVNQSEEPKEFIIYTAPDNHASSKGILKAGFQFVGTMTAANGSLKRYLHNQGFTGIYRKNRFWGLKVTN